MVFFSFYITCCSEFLLCIRA